MLPPEIMPLLTALEDLCRAHNVLSVHVEKKGVRLDVEHIYKAGMCSTHAISYIEGTTILEAFSKITEDRARVERQLAAEAADHFDEDYYPHDD